MDNRIIEQGKTDFGNLVTSERRDQLCIIPIDPNPAISAHAVFPQSGHIRPEKRPFFQKFPHFAKGELSKKYKPHICFQYIKLKPIKSSFICKRNDFVLMDR